MPRQKTEVYDQLWDIVASPAQWVPVVVVLAVLFGFGIWLRARFRDDDGPAEGSLELLNQFRDLRQRGELSEDEFRSIRSQLSVTSHRLLTGGNRRSETGSGTNTSDSASDAASAGPAEETAETLPTDSIQGRGASPGA